MMTAAERYELEAASVAMKDKDRPRKWRELLLTKTIEDTDGQSFINAGNAKEFFSLPAKDVEALFDKAVSVNGMGSDAGFGLSILLDYLSTSFKSADELDGQIDLPVLAAISSIATRSVVLQKRRQQVVAAMLCVGTIGLGAALIRLYSQYVY